MNYWLLKSEPACFGLADLKRRPKQTAPWDGVRNYQARNYLRNGMARGDLAFFYHSSCAEPGIAGVVEVVREGYPDHTALDPESEHYDPKSTLEKPVWYMVDVRLKREFRAPVTLATLRNTPALAKMPLLARGNRLSVLPMSKREWDVILKLARG